jgi:ankyrin repeat protein
MEQRRMRYVIMYYPATEDLRVRLPQVLDWLFSTTSEGLSALHLAAVSGNVKLVKHLLDRGASPTITDFKNRVPYYLCTSKSVRDVFRKSRADNPDRFVKHYDLTRLTGIYAS